MEAKKFNKIREIVKLQQILKKWRKLAASSSTKTSTTTITASKGLKFLKRTLSFTDTPSSSYSSTWASNVPKGYLAVCVGQELKRFIIPMEYLRHRAFEHLLREAEEEFGFEQEGVLTIPCETAVFEKVLRVLEQKESGSKMMKVLGFDEDGSGDGKREKNCFCGSEAEVALFGVSRHHPNHKSLCR